MKETKLQLWWAYPDDALNEEVAIACASLLSEEERARWQAYKFERLRREYLVTRALARTALSHNQSIQPEALRFTLNQYGKPSVDDASGLHFNLSNSPGLVACLISNRGEVGVDVEPSDRAKQIAEVAQRMFSTLELSQLSELSLPEQLDRCLSLWTLKEAYIKARGMGFSLPLKKFSFLFRGAEGIRMELDDCLSDSADRWRFCILDHAGHRISVMVPRVESSDPNFEVLEMRPMLRLPARLANIRPEWNPCT